MPKEIVSGGQIFRAGEGEMSLSGQQPGGKGPPSLEELARRSVGGLAREGEEQTTRPSSAEPTPAGPPTPKIPEREITGQDQNSDEELLQDYTKRLRDAFEKGDFNALRREILRLLYYRILSPEGSIKSIEETTLNRWMGELKSLAKTEEEKQDYQDFFDFFHAVVHLQNLWVEFKGPNGIGKGFDHLKGVGNMLTTKDGRRGDIITLLSREDVVREFHNFRGYVEALKLDYTETGKGQFKNPEEILGHKLRRVTGATIYEFQPEVEKTVIVTDTKTGEVVEVYNEKTGKWEPYKVPYFGESGRDYQDMLNRFPLAYFESSYPALYTDRSLLLEPVYKIDPLTGEPAVDPQTGKVIILDYINHADVFYTDYWHDYGNRNFWLDNALLIGKENRIRMGWEEEVAFYNPYTGKEERGKLYEVFEKVKALAKRAESESRSDYYNRLFSEQRRLEELLVSGEYNEKTKKFKGGLRMLDLHSRLTDEDIREIENSPKYREKLRGKTLDSLRGKNPYFLDFTNPTYKSLWEFGGMMDLNTWYTNQGYIADYARDYISTVAGNKSWEEKIKAILAMDTERGFRHLGRGAYEKIREQKLDYFSGLLSEVLLGQYELQRHSGARYNLAVAIDNAIETVGFMKGFYRTHLWEPVGIKNVSWGDVEKLRRLSPEERMRMILHVISEKEILTQGLLKDWNERLQKLGRKERLTYEDLLAFAGLELVEAVKDKHIVFDWRQRLVRGKEYGAGEREIEIGGQRIRLMGEEYCWSKLRLSRERRISKEKEELITFLMQEPGLAWDFTFFRRFERMKAVLIDKYIKNTWEKENKIEGREWGLDFDPWAREKYFWRLYRRQRYTLGDYQGRFIYNQFTPEGDQITKYNIPAFIERFRRIKPDIKVSDLLGEDQLGSLFMGTAELRPGESEKLTPLYPFYDTNRMMYAMLASTSASYWKEALELLKNEGRAPPGLDWEQWKGYQRVATPEKLAAIISVLGPSGWRRVKASTATIDPDEEVYWLSRIIGGGEKRGLKALLQTILTLDTAKKLDFLNKRVVPKVDGVIQEFTAKRRRLAIPNLEGRVDVQELAADKEQIDTALGAIFKTIPGAELLFPAGQIKRLANLEQIKSWAKYVASGIGVTLGSQALLIANGATGSMIGFPLLGGIIFTAATAIWGVDKSDENANPRSWRIRWGRFINYITGGFLTNKIPPNFPIFGGLRKKGLLCPLFKIREAERDPENLIYGKAPVWDDMVDAVGWIGLFSLWKEAFGTGEKRK